MSPFASAAKAFRDAVAALKPYGATPILTLALAVAGIAGMSYGGPQLGIIALVLFAFGFHYWTQERKAEWRKRDLEVEYDALERKDALAVRRKLDRRLQRTRNRNQPTLFDGEEAVANDD